MVFLLLLFATFWTKAMREYGIVSPMFWVGATGRSLRKDPNAQRVAIYLMTSPMSEMTGVYYCPLASILNDVGTLEAYPKPLTSPSEGGADGFVSPFEVVKQAILTLMELDFCFYDFESEFVFVNEMARWQIGESLKEKDNRVAGLRKSVRSMPKSIAAMFVERYNEDFCLGFDLETFGENLKGKTSPSEAPSEHLERDSMKPLRSQEQEQEQEQEQDINNPNKEQTEICNEEPACESGVSFEDSIYEQADALALNQTTEVVSDPDAVVNPIQVMGLARMHGIKGQRDHELNELCAKGILTVDNTRQCIRITKKSQKGWRYLVGVMKNAVYEPSQYHTDEYIRREREAFEARIDENKVFE